MPFSNILTTILTMKKLFFLLPILAAAWLMLLTTCCKVSIDLPDPPDPTATVNVWDTLPAITQEGKYTFGCLKNDSVWVPHGFSLSGPIKSLHFDESKGLGYGYGECQINWNYKTEILYFSFGNSFYNNTEYHSSPDTSEANLFSAIMLLEDKFYEMDNSKPIFSNRFKLTKIDTVRNFVSGLFNFTLYYGQNDSIVITNGRFDMLYYPQ
jgi:hypothetical protein